MSDKEKVMTFTTPDKVHRAVASGDLRSLAFLIGTMNNAVGKLVEGDDYEPTPRPQLNGGDALSKIALLRALSEDLDMVADAIENDEEGHDS